MLKICRCQISLLYLFFFFFCLMEERETNFNLQSALCPNNLKTMRFEKFFYVTCPVTPLNSATHIETVLGHDQRLLWESCSGYSSKFQPIPDKRNCAVNVEWVSSCFATTPCDSAIYHSDLQFFTRKQMG